MPKYRIPSGPVFCDTLCQVATVVMETDRLLLFQSGPFCLINWFQAIKKN